MYAPHRVLGGGTESTTLLLVFKKSLYPRARFGEAITVMQQWLLSLVLGHIEFDIVDLLICEWEDWFADGFKGKRRMPMFISSVRSWQIP